MAASSENSTRKEKVPTNRQGCSLKTAGLAAKELSFDFDGPLATAFTLSVNHQVASQSLSWRPVTRCAWYTRKVAPTRKKDFRLGPASSVGGKREIS